MIIKLTNSHPVGSMNVKQNSMKMYPIGFFFFLHKTKVNLMISARDQVSTRSLGYMHTCPVDIGIIQSGPN